MEIDLKSVNENMTSQLAGHLGIKMVELKPGKAVATMAVTPHHHQPMGILHGGVSVALAETVASVGGWYLVAKENKFVVGQEINANHLKKVRSGELRAEATVIHQGRSSQVWEIKIYNEAKELICISRCTLAVINL